MADLSEVAGVLAESRVLAVRTAALGGQMADAGWPTQALVLAAELDYRAGFAAQILQRTHGVTSPTVREAIVHVPVGDAGLPGKVLQYTLHAALNAGHPDVLAPVLEAAGGLGMPADDVRSTLLLLESRKERTAALIDAVRHRVAPGARVMTGLPGQPPYLNEARVGDLYASYQGRPNAMSPAIRELGKADLLISDPDGARWIGVSLKSRRSKPERHAGVALAITADPSTTSTRIERTEGLVLVHLGDVSTLLSHRREAMAAWRHAHDLVMGVGHLHHVGQKAKSLGRYLVDNEDARAFDLADELWREAQLPGRPADIRWDDVTASTQDQPSQLDQAELVGVV